MKPSPFQFLIASRYTFPLWVGLGLYLYFEHGWRWDTWNEQQRLEAVYLPLAIFALLWLVSFPTTFFYESEQARYRRSALSPEERWQRKTVRQTLILVLLAIGAVLFGYYYWKNAPSTPPAQPVSFKTVSASLAASGILLGTTAYLKAKSLIIRPPTDNQTPYVRYCQSIAQEAQDKAARQLPDYCTQVLAAGAVTVPTETSALTPTIQPEAEASSERSNHHGDI